MVESNLCMQGQPLASTSGGHIIRLLVISISGNSRSIPARPSGSSCWLSLVPLGNSNGR